jgi:hypothetical protein
MIGLEVGDDRVRGGGKGLGLGKWEDFRVAENKERFSIGKSGRVRKEGRVKSGKREGVSVGKGEWLGGVRVGKGERLVVGKGGRIKC